MQPPAISPILLCTLCALAAHGGQPDILERSTQAAVRQMAALSSWTCTENVTESRFDPKQKLEEQRRRVFDYFVMVDDEEGEVGVTESRIEHSIGKTKEGKPLLASTGFATMILIVHPHYRDSFRFVDLGAQEDEGRAWRRIGFEFIAGKKSPSVLRVSTREYPLSWTGEMLVDEATGGAGLIRAHLSAPLQDIGLEDLTAEVRYGPTQLTPAAADWVPISAKVDLRTRHQHWRNTHRFSDYKRFEVTAVEKRGLPE